MYHNGIFLVKTLTFASCSLHPFPMSSKKKWEKQWRRNKTTINSRIWSRRHHHYCRCHIFLARLHEKYSIMHTFRINYDTHNLLQSNVHFVYFKWYCSSRIPIVQSSYLCRPYSERISSYVSQTHTHRPELHMGPITVSVSYKFWPVNRIEKQFFRQEKKFFLKNFMEGIFIKIFFTLRF